MSLYRYYTTKCRFLPLKPHFYLPIVDFGVQTGLQPLVEIWFMSNK